jgi:hypothetical protein
MIKKECEKGKILNILTNRCVKIDGKIGKEIIKREKGEKREKREKGEKGEKEEKGEKGKKGEEKYKIVNKSIIEDVDKNDVILDPAGLRYMQTNFKGAGYASGEIYKLLSVSGPTEEVKKHYLQFKNEDYLYEKNKKKESVAQIGIYKNIKIIHAVGPDFRTSEYLRKIIMKEDLRELYKLFYKIYKDIYKIFMKEYEKNKKLRLRILPISTGAYINNKEEYKRKIFKCIEKIYVKLNERNKIKAEMYIYKKEDYELFRSFIT